MQIIKLYIVKGTNYVEPVVLNNNLFELNITLLMIIKVGKLS